MFLNFLFFLRIFKNIETIPCIENWFQYFSGKIKKWQPMDELRRRKKI